MSMQRTKKDYSLAFSDTMSEYLELKKAEVERKGGKARLSPYMNQACWNRSYENLFLVHLYCEELKRKELEEEFFYLSAALPFKGKRQSKFSLERLRTWTNRVFQLITKKMKASEPKRLVSCSLNEWLWENGGLVIFKALGPIFHNLRMLTVIFIAR